MDLLKLSAMEWLHAVSRIHAIGQVIIATLGNPPFLSFASRKNFIAIYHMGLYVKQQPLAGFPAEYPKHLASKQDICKVVSALKS